MFCNQYRISVDLMPSHRAHHFDHSSFKIMKISHIARGKMKAFQCFEFWGHHICMGKISTGLVKYQLSGWNINCPGEMSTVWVKYQLSRSNINCPGQIPTSLFIVIFLRNFSSLFVSSSHLMVSSVIISTELQALFRRTRGPACCNRLIMPNCQCPSTRGSIQKQFRSAVA